VTSVTSPDRVPELLSAMAARLDAAGIHDETLGAWKHSRGLFGIGASDALVPAGRAWRLGVLLLDRGGFLYSTGQVTRAIQPGRAAVNRSAAGEERRAIRAIAAHGPFPRGEVINHGWEPIAVDPASLEAGAGPLSLRDGEVMVEIDAKSGDLGIVPLERYLADRFDILLGD
jgi:hypothetical protein